MKTLGAMLYVLVVLALFACGDEPAGVDAPCATTEDCEEGLECDLHEGEGTCQEVHED